jgi:hypothetical protein
MATVANATEPLFITSTALPIALWSCTRSSGPFTAPANARTTFPSRSMTNVSGKPVTP